MDGDPLNQEKENQWKKDHDQKEHPEKPNITSFAV
jgi:hypothetical protein